MSYTGHEAGFASLELASAPQETSPPRACEHAAAWLAALGPVLLLERGGAGSDDDCAARLALACARGAIVPRVRLDAGAGMHEELAVLDADGATRLRLVRLPESDWLGWDRALERAGAWIDAANAPLRRDPGAGAAPIRREARALPSWRARPVRLCRGTDAAAPLRVQALPRCSWMAWRVIDALRAVEPVELAAPC